MTPTKKTARRPDRPRTNRGRFARRRGIILIFVVALLVLLAIMGTAYLSVARADRLASTGRGGSLEGFKRPLLRDVTQLDKQFGKVRDRVFQRLVEDLFNQRVGNPAGDPGATLLSVSDKFSATEFRNPGTIYKNIDAYGPTDTFLASLLPAQGTIAAPAAAPRWWPWVSAPLSETNTSSGAASTYEWDPIFTDPRRLRPTGFSAVLSTLPGNPASVSAARFARTISSVTLGERNPSVKTARVYPGLGIGGNPAPTAPINAGSVMIAGDADGDGIADSGLVPVVLNSSFLPNNVNRYLDPQNNVVYFYSYRVVDNSAAVNLNTALSVRSDFPIQISAGDADANRTIAWAAQRDPAGGLLPPGTTAPNLGFFPSNVGLLELIKPGLTYFGADGAWVDDQSSPNLAAAEKPVTDEVAELLKQIIPGLDITGAAAPDVSRVMYADGTAPVPMYVAVGDQVNAPTAGAFTQEVEYLSLGDLLFTAGVRRFAKPGDWNPNSAVKTSSFEFFDASVSTSLAYRGGLLNTRNEQTAAEKAMPESLVYNAPNYVTNSNNAWGYFPANEIELWYEWTKDFSNVIDTATPNTAILAPQSPQMVIPFTGAQTTVSRGYRSLLTGLSGTTTLVPQRGQPVGAPPTSFDPPQGMPTYAATITGSFGAGGELASTYPAEKVSLATGTKEQLWRAFWSSMVRQTTIGADAETPSGSFSFNSPDRWGGSVALPGVNLSNNETAILRGAIAAANTVDLRDLDNDITCFDAVKLSGRDAAGSIDDATPVIQAEARVFGNEKTIAIAEVLIDIDNATAPGTPTKYVAIELFNPYNEELSLAGYYVSIVNRSAGATNVNNAGLTVATGSTVLKLTDPAFAGMPTALQPGEMIVLVSAAVPPAGSNISPPTNVAGVTNVVVAPTTLGLAELGENEFVISRTRRNDGVLYVDPRGRPQFDEVATNIFSFAPVDLFDARSIDPTIDPNPTRFRYIYRRESDQTTDDGAWRWAFAGKTGAYDPANPATADTPATRDPATTAIVEEIANPPLPLSSLGTPNVGATGGTSLVSASTFPAATRAPRIQLQNFLPEPGLFEAFRFPFASPFARDGDVMQIPFAGSYTLFRRAPAGIVRTPWEINPLPVDAARINPQNTPSLTDPLVRFDPNKPETAWAADVLDFVTARQAPSHAFLPDVPRVAVELDASQPVPQQDQNPVYQGSDGAVQGAESANTVDPFVQNQLWIQNRSGTSTQLRRGNIVQSATGNLSLGRININTAPAAVLRMLPWAVDTSTGFADTVAGGPIDLAVTNIVTARGETLASPAPFYSVGQVVKDVPSLKFAGGLTTAASASQMVLAGDLSPRRRQGSVPQPIVGGSSAIASQGSSAGLADFDFEQLNVNRISSLASTRSDVFTVYVTVQAWTYSPTNQATDTRLVGEKRAAFIVDRSKIDATKSKISDLVVYPVESN